MELALKGLKRRRQWRRWQTGGGLNIKEFAAVTGYSYERARLLFREAGFPVVKGLVFWEDWREYRRAAVGTAGQSPEPDGVRRLARQPPN